MRKFSLLLTIFLFLNSEVFAQELAASPALIIQQIASRAGPVTREEYDQFWKTLDATSRADKERVINLLRSGFLLTQEYQKEVWICVENSWNSRAPFNCDKSQKKLDAMKKIMNEEQIAALKKMDENSQRMIQAAAKREEFKITAEATPLKLTVENIRAMRESLEKILKRIDRVLRVDY